MAHCSARLRSVALRDIPLCVHDRGNLKVLEGVVAQVAEHVAQVLAPKLMAPKPKRRRWRAGVLADVEHLVTAMHDVVVEPAEASSEDSLFNDLIRDGDSSEDGLFNELTQEDPETPRKKPPIMSPSLTDSPETPTWILEAIDMEIRKHEETGYEADEEAQEEEPCFFIDVKGEPLWLNDDDFSDDGESFTW